MGGGGHGAGAGTTSARARGLHWNQPSALRVNPFPAREHVLHQPLRRLPPRRVHNQCSHHRRIRRRAPTTARRKRPRSRRSLVVEAGLIRHRFREIHAIPSPVSVSSTGAC